MLVRTPIKRGTWLFVAILIFSVTGCTSKHASPASKSAPVSAVPIAAAGAPSYCNALSSIPGITSLQATLTELADTSSAPAAQASLDQMATGLTSVAGGAPSDVMPDLETAATDLRSFAKSAYSSKSVSDALVADWSKLSKVVQSACKFPLQ